MRQIFLLYRQTQELRKVSVFLSEGARLSLKIISEPQTAPCPGLFPWEGCAVRLQTMPNSTSSLYPLPSTSSPSAILQSLGREQSQLCDSNLVFPCLFSSERSRKERVIVWVWSICSTWSPPSQACGKVCLLIITGLYLRSQVLRQTRETISTSPAAVQD